MVEYRTVRVTLAEVVRPGIDMRIEVHQRELARRAVARQRAQQRQRDAVFAAKCDAGGVSSAACCSISRRLCRNVAERKVEVADIGDVERRTDRSRIPDARRPPACGWHAGWPADHRAHRPGWWYRCRAGCRRQRIRRCGRAAGYPGSWAAWRTWADPPFVKLPRLPFYIGLARRSALFARPREATGSRGRPKRQVGGLDQGGSQAAPTPPILRNG